MCHNDSTSYPTTCSLNAGPFSRLSRERDLHSDIPATVNGHSPRKPSEVDNDIPSSRTQLIDDLQVDIQQHDQAVVNGADARAPLALGDRENRSPSYNSHMNDIGQHGLETGSMTPATSNGMQNEQNGLSMLEDPNRNSTDRRWGLCGDAVTCGDHRPVNGDRSSPPRPRRSIFSHRTRTGCKACRKRRRNVTSESSLLRESHHPCQPPLTAALPPRMVQQTHLPPPSSDTNSVSLTSHYTLSQPYYAPQSSEPHGRPRHTDNSQHSRVSSCELYQHPPPSYGYYQSSYQRTPPVSGPPSTGFRVFSAEEIERSKMLRHHRYAHEDTTLIWDRARCEAATDKYDSLLALGPGVREDQKRDHLSFILEPSLDTYYKHKIPLPKEKGMLSMDVTVKRSFKCSYGYNIKIMDHVFIDYDVTIDDAAKVEIGARSYIGEGTRIITSTPCSDLAGRTGPTTERVAQNIVIESDVQIGAHCIIMPGVRLSRGCRIEGAMTVTRNVESMQTYGPAAQFEMLQKAREGHGGR